MCARIPASTAAYEMIYSFHCRPLLSQVRELWKGMTNHLTSKQAELRIARDECDLLRVFTQRYEKSYHPV